MESKFDMPSITQGLMKALKSMKERSQVPFEPICYFLEQFCILFNKLNSFLGLAFEDIKKKLNHIYNNNKRFPNHYGFLSFIDTQMKYKVHMLNGSNNSEFNTSPQFASYSSTARNLLRVMWFMTFIKTTFQGCKNDPNQKLTSILATSYDVAFGEKHNFILRQTAKVSIYAFSENRQSFIAIILGKYDQKLFSQVNDAFLNALMPVYDFLWGFYRKNNLVDLQ